MKNKYYSYCKTVNYLYKLQEEYPKLIKVQSIGTSWEERNIILVTISLNVNLADTKPALLYTGTIHAREWIRNELAVKFIEYIVKNYQFDPRLSQTLDKSTIYIVSCLNPDDFEYSKNHFSFWRENRRNNGDGNFGAIDIEKYYSIFIYNDVPNFSKPITLKYKG